MNLSNKRVLLILHEGALGGAQRQALGLGRYLSQECNCKVDLLLTFSDKTTKEFDEYLEQCSINKVMHFGKPYLFVKKEFSIRNLKRFKWTIQYLLKLRKGLIEHQPEIIIPYLNFPSKVAFYLYKLLPSAQFTFWHQLGLDSLSMDIMESIAVNNTPCVIGNAPNCLEMFNNEYHIDKGKLNILPQNVTLERVDLDKKEIRKKFNIPEDSIVISMIAHFRYDKYHDLVLDVFTKLQKKYPLAHLLFLGNKENKQDSYDKFIHLGNRIEENNLRHRVTLLSNEEVNEVLNIIDIGVLISLTEGTPNVVMEYMLYGLPVVASNHPGCIGLLRESSFLVENNENTIYEKLSILIESKNLRDAEGIKNLGKIKEYDVVTYVNKLEKIINKTIK
ncbi:glycosyltransferase [Flavobacterium sp.]|uniref:glycosyltransferase n=1 Tax=Flavobacterium sp. TaxID=239 RepID=UPI002B4AEB4A|nr:glycosyltransferase [Flavobacterium sp.]HLF51223.1 glycosyltransferase [Flavobacterium sp.]